MTGVVEAGVVLGLISSSVDIYKTCYEIYQVAQDLDGLTPEFKNVADLIPLMLMSLESAQHNIGTQCPPSEVVQVSENCKAHALEVKNTFDKILPSTGDTKTARFTKALNLKWKSRDVRKTMEMAFRDIDLLANHRVLCDSEAIKEVKEAIQQLADMKANEAQGVTVNHGNIMNARDSARIDARSFNASDQARQYSAETMHFGKDSG
ncbi:hypothetical protein K461DRAFT_274406 [Myriangium duriaei CBS 260.36]|uniref:NACHT-NTPase and P-loop NTPases N-terminal domain-containing protein n=1 Tax=Myriangium duriaei CBS 260.36 TaxID=1168546 RepID=A0A9P4MQC5_9PEZI|nr:hypothetical protein K461DRAFT_274406 [Myriangium duriaei CBS 260.36]